MAVVKSLVTRWGFEVDLKPLAKMRDSLAELRSGLRTIGYEAAAAAGALFAVAETTAKAGKEASLNAARTGMNVEAFQELAFAAKKAGVDSDGFTISLAHMNRSLFEARMGNKEAGQGFAMLGRDVTGAIQAHKPSTEIFMKVADGLSRIKDEGTRGALAMKIFGRSGYMLAPMFKDGAPGIRKLAEEARELGLVMSEDDVKASKAFMHSLHEVEGIMVGMKRTIGVSLLKPMKEVFDSFSMWLRVNREVIKQNITAFFEGLGTVLKGTLKVFNIVMARVSGMVKPLGGLGAAAKYAALAIAAIASVKILAAIGSLAKEGFGLLKKAIVSYKNEALLADAATAAIPLAIGVAVLAVIAIIEDLIGFFQGKDSITGRLLASFKEAMPELYDTMAGLFTGLKAVISDLWMIMKPVALWFGGGLLDSIRAAAAAISIIFQGLDWGFKMINKGIGMARGFLGPEEGQGSVMSAMLNQAPNANSIPGANSSSAAPNINVTNTVTVPAGTDPHMVGDRVEDGVAKALDPHLRAANRSFAPVIGH